MSEGAPKLTAELSVVSAVPCYPLLSPDRRWVAYAVASKSMQ